LECLVAVVGLERCPEGDSREAERKTRTTSESHPIKIVDELQYSSTQGAGTWTITWEFWNGTSWTALSGVTDGTTGFKAAAGSHDVTWTMPSTWVDCEVKSKNVHF
jgi:hypothetical protein